ncbi:hypothetical protein B0T10DRAFT_479838, partial [Thelonectria olida]
MPPLSDKTKQDTLHLVTRFHTAPVGAWDRSSGEHEQGRIRSRSLRGGGTIPDDPASLVIGHSVSHARLPPSPTVSRTVYGTGDLVGTAATSTIPPANTQPRVTQPHPRFPLPLNPSIPRVSCRPELVLCTKSPAFCSGIFHEPQCTVVELQLRPLYPSTPHHPHCRSFNLQTPPSPIAVEPLQAFPGFAPRRQRTKWSPLNVPSHGGLRRDASDHCDHPQAHQRQVIS